MVEVQNQNVGTIGFFKDLSPWLVVKYLPDVSSHVDAEVCILIPLLKEHQTHEIGLPAVSSG